MPNSGLNAVPLGSLSVSGVSGAPQGFVLRTQLFFPVINFTIKAHMCLCLLISILVFWVIPRGIWNNDGEWPTRRIKWKGGRRQRRAVLNMRTILQSSCLAFSSLSGFYSQNFLKNTIPPLWATLRNSSHLPTRQMGFLSEYSIYLRRPYRTKKRCQPREALDLITVG